MIFILFYFIFLAVPHGLRDLSSPTRDRMPVLEVRAPSPNHWTTRELPQFLFLISFYRGRTTSREIYPVNTLSSTHCSPDNKEHSLFSSPRTILPASLKPCALKPTSLPTRSFRNSAAVVHSLPFFYACGAEEEGTETSMRPRLRGPQGHPAGQSFLQVALGPE